MSTWLAVTTIAAICASVGAALWAQALPAATVSTPNQTVWIIFIEFLLSYGSRVQFRLMVTAQSDDLGNFATVTIAVSAYPPFFKLLSVTDLGAALCFLYSH